MKRKIVNEISAVLLCLDIDTLLAIKSVVSNLQKGAGNNGTTTEY
jgi:hypothetical protein